MPLVYFGKCCVSFSLFVDLRFLTKTTLNSSSFFCWNIHQNRSLYQQMLFTISEQKKIAKFFQCLDELLQPHIISVSEDNKDYNYQTPHSAPTLWTVTGLNLNLTMVDVWRQNILFPIIFIHYRDQRAAVAVAAAAACVTVCLCLAGPGMAGTECWADKKLFHSVRTENCNPA